MPISFEPAKHPAEPVDSAELLKYIDVSPADFLSQTTQEHDLREVQELLQSSLQLDSTFTAIPRTNGFVDTVIEAYNNHRALVIRPDDVWLAILTQFSIFVNNNAEDMRSSFVNHEGQKTLRIAVPGTRYTVDFGGLAQQMTRLIRENVTDPSLHDWIIPNFTTTTPNDTAVCSVVMMATMKAYFRYEVHLRCGIPHVTLEGTKEDWEKILSKLEKLKQYGLQPIAWYHLLHPIVSRFVSAFDHPDSPENLDFWSKVAHFKGSSSGPSYRAGWITAFCVFNTGKTQWQGEQFNEDNPKLLPGPETEEIARLPAAEFFERYFVKPQRRAYLVLDEARYPWIVSNKIPAGFAEVDVKLNDNGAEFDTVMVAGSVGTKISGERKEVVSPMAGWWIYIKP